jgi:hypothetical protein
MGGGAISKLISEDDLKSLAYVVSEEAKKDVEGKDLVNREDAINEVKRLRMILNENYRKVQAGVEREKELKRRIKDGKIKVIYEQYDDMFAISDGKLNVNALDEEYCLSDIMPGVTLELISCKPQEKINQEIKGIPVPFVRKSDDGADFIELFAYNDGEIKSYWVLAYQDVKQREEDLKKTRERLALENNHQNSNDTRKEGCSCIEGNPCTEANKYNCKNWNNRFEVAKKNGWKGF